MLDAVSSTYTSACYHLFATLGIPNVRTHVCLLIHDNLAHRRPCGTQHFRGLPTSDLSSTNEDLGRINKRGNPDFRLSVQWLVPQIEYSHPRKVLRKSGFHLLFLIPKSSFGEHRIGKRASPLTKITCYSGCMSMHDASLSTCPIWRG
jgi:hypothetical protein